MAVIRLAERNGERGSARRLETASILPATRWEGIFIGNCAATSGSVKLEVRGCSSMVELQPSKLAMRVRFPPPAPGPIATAGPSRSIVGPQMDHAAAASRRGAI